MKSCKFLLTLASIIKIVWAGPHFLHVSSFVDSVGSLHVLFEEAGLGNQNVDYSLSLIGFITFFCADSSGHNLEFGATPPEQLTAVGDQNGHVNVEIIS